MIHYLNNCQSIDHADFYKEVAPDAFFDLYTNGRDERYIPTFQVDDVCIVASKLRRVKEETAGIEEVVAIKRYKLKSTVVHPYKPGLNTFVLCGPQIEGESMPKSQAASHEQYGIFFNRRVHFKQATVLRSANDA